MFSGFASLTHVISTPFIKFLTKISLRDTHAVVSPVELIDITVCIKNTIEQSKYQTTVDDVRSMFYTISSYPNWL